VIWNETLCFLYRRDEREEEEGYVWRKLVTTRESLSIIYVSTYTRREWMMMMMMMLSIDVVVVFLCGMRKKAYDLYVVCLVVFRLPKG
jgi:hypothetical protein